MRYKVTSDSLLFGEKIFDIKVDYLDYIFPIVTNYVFKNMNKIDIPIPTDMVIKNGTDKIVFTYTYPINSDPVSIVFNIENID